MPDAEHRSKQVDSVPCAVVTVSDTRTEATDASGAWLRERLAQEGHLLHSYRILPDEPDQVRNAVRELAGDPDCRAVFLCGGTGLAPRDTTIEAVEPLLDRRLDGFGELFRMLSFERVGPSAMLSRAMGGTCGTTLVFVMPGSPDAVRLAMERLILPTLRHLAAVAERG